jgi:hypothetical protein
MPQMIGLTALADAAAGTLPPTQAPVFQQLIDG